MAQCQRFHAQMVRLFIGLSLYLAGRCCDNHQSTSDPRNVNPDKKSNYIMSPNEVDELAHYTMQSGEGCPALEHDISSIPLR